jgi:hypothetical protein
MADPSPQFTNCRTEEPPLGTSVPPGVRHNMNGAIADAEMSYSATGDGKIRGFWSFFTGSR